MSDVPLRTVRAVAKLLGISEDAVLALIASGRLAAINVGLGTKRPRWRITADALETFLAARTPAPKRGPNRKRKPGNVIEFF